MLPVSLADWISAWASTDRVAFHFEGQATTYAELDRQIGQMARSLAMLGVEPGDRVGFIGLNRVELFQAFFASAKLGAIFLPFNNRLIASELAAQIDDAQPAVILCTDGFASLAVEAGGEQVFDLDRGPLEAGLPIVGYTPGPQTTVLMVYTSGTTGKAKGAMLSHDAIVHTALNGIDHQRLDQDAVILALLPTFHVGGLNIQVLPTLKVGGQVVLQRRFDAGDALSLIEKYGATQTILVPATLRAVAEHPAFATTDLSSLVGINSGSSVVPVALAAAKTATLRTSRLPASKINVPLEPVLSVIKLLRPR